MRPLEIIWITLHDVSLLLYNEVTVPCVDSAILHLLAVGGKDFLGHTPLDTDAFLSNGWSLRRGVSNYIQALINIFNVDMEKRSRHKYQ